MLDPGAQEIKQTLSFLVKSLVHEPCSVEVTAQEQNDELLITVFVSEQDFARFGEQGCRILRALDTVLKAMAKRERFDVTMEVVGRVASSRFN